MSWFDIVKKDYESIEEELEDAHKNIQKVKGNQEAIMFSLGLLTRGRSYSMLSDKDKELRDNMLEEIKRLSKLLTEMAKEGMQMIEDATAFATTDEGTDFINRNI